MKPSEQTKPANLEQERDAFVEQMLSSTRGAFEIYTIHMGHKLNFYRTLAESAALTAPQLAQRTSTHSRYVREWLEQQTVAGILGVENSEANAYERRYFLPESRSEVLTSPDSLNYLAPLAQLVVGATRPVSEVIKAFRNGGGVSFDSYGEDVRAGVAHLNRPMFLELLGTEWLPSITDIHQRLVSDPPAKVADIGCGTGWSSIGIAKAYANVSVDGYDMDAPSIEQARMNATEAGLDKRVQFHVHDASDPSIPGTYDLVTAFECIHDMANPVGALRTMLTLAGDKGSVIVMDERTADSFTPQGNEIEALLYGFSVLACLPAGMSEKPSAQTGTVMRPDTLSKYATEAGFCQIGILPIDNYFFRFYRLRQNCLR